MHGNMKYCVSIHTACILEHDLNESNAHRFSSLGFSLIMGQIRENKDVRAKGRD